MENIDLIALAEIFNTFTKVSYIRRLPNGKYRVYSEKGRNMGTFKTKEQAKQHLAEIEAFKHMKGK